MSFHDCPKDVLLSIFSNLRVNDLVSCEIVCKLFNQVLRVSESEPIWNKELELLKDEIELAKESPISRYMEEFTQNGSPASGEWFPNTIYGIVEILCTPLDIRDDKIDDPDLISYQMVPDKLFTQTKLNYEIPKTYVDGKDFLSSLELCKISCNSFKNWKIFQKFPEVEAQRFLVCGLPGCGKSTFLAQMLQRNEKFQNTLKIIDSPPKGFFDLSIVETSINGITSFFIEVNGEPPDWTDGVHGVLITGIIFITDSFKELNQNEEQLLAYRRENYRLLHNTIGWAHEKKANLFVVANKWDLVRPELSIDEEPKIYIQTIVDYLRLNALATCHWYENCKVYCCVADSRSGEGLIDSFNYFNKYLSVEFKLEFFLKTEIPDLINGKEWKVPKFFRKSNTFWKILFYLDYQLIKNYLQSPSEYKQQIKNNIKNTLINLLENTNKQTHQNYITNLENRF